MKISSIIIVGGGSSGWMTCAALRENFKNLKITLIEPKNAKTIGVGESTLPQINDFLKLCNLKDGDFMPHSNATYKLSIKFNNFNTRGSFHYPLCQAKPNNKIKQLPPDILLDLISEKNLSPNTFAAYFNQTVDLSELNKMTYNIQYANDLDDNSVAYHFEADKFAYFLRSRYKNKINYIVDEVIDFDVDQNGISKLIFRSSKELTADLYIDCTGFKSLLIKNFTEYDEFNTLINDRAVVGPVEYKDKENEMIPYTNCTALSSGWVWDTPTWSRKGMGYVYSSKFISDDDARKEFLNFVGEEIDTRIVNIKSGIHKKGWCKNVVSIGLSYGFLEPLESTGLATTQEAIKKLVNILANRNCYINYFDRERYNTTIDSQIRRMKNFTEIHYAMSDREDTPYWKYVTNEIEYKSEALSNFYELSVSNHKIGFDNAFPDIYIFAGMGYMQDNKATLRFIKNTENGIKSKSVFEDVLNEWVNFRSYHIEKIKTLQSHYDYLKQNIYN
jgi:tryptophan halogenase